MSETDCYVVHYDDAPEFLKDNEYIKRGYRANFNNFKKILKSLFMLHNESVNVWSHLLGAIFIVVLMIYTGLYIERHFPSFEEINSNWKVLKEDLDDFTHPLWDVMPSIHNFTEKINEKYENSKLMFNEFREKIKNQTDSYIGSIDEKIIAYRNFINDKMKCLECFKEIFSKFNDFSSNLMNSHFEQIFKDSDQFKKFFDKLKLENYLDEVKLRVKEFKDEILQKIHSEEIKWFEESALIEKWPLFAFLFGAVACLSLSATLHLCFVHSKKWSDFLTRLDYAGISLLIAGSCFPIYAYSFHCYENLKIFYLTLITLINSTCFVCALSEDFSSPKNRTFRGLLFLSAGVSSGGPLIHMFLLWNTDGMIKDQSLILWLGGGLSYLLGVIVYVLRFPEKYWPGRFCIVGSSHQIWHCFVLLGIIFHYCASLRTYHERLDDPFCF